MKSELFPVQLVWIAENLHSRKVLIWAFYRIYIHISGCTFKHTWVFVVYIL